MTAPPPATAGPEPWTTSTDHDALIAGACAHLRLLLGADDTWLHPPGAAAEAVATIVAEATTRTGVPAATVADPAGGAAIAAIVHQHALPRPLVVWSARARRWTDADRVALAETCRTLTARLEETAAEQRTPAQRARELTDRLRDHLMTTLNHELRTPLAVISMGLELLGDEVPATAGDLLARIDRNVRRLSEVADDVRALGGAAYDELVSALDRSTEDGRVRSEVGPAVACACAGHPEIDLDVGTVPLMIAMPADELVDVVRRLVDNALKYSVPAPGAGPPEVTVRVHAVGDQAVIDVVDRGMGIPEVEQFRIGEPFFRASNGRVAERQGPGLGLAIVTERLRRRSGRLEVDSRPGIGTRARVRLPLATRDVPATS